MARRTIPDRHFLPMHWYMTANRLRRGAVPFAPTRIVPRPAQTSPPSKPESSPGPARHKVLKAQASIANRRMSSWQWSQDTSIKQLAPLLLCNKDKTGKLTPSDPAFRPRLSSGLPWRRRRSRTRPVETPATTRRLPRAQLGRHYLSYASCIIRPHLFSTALLV